MKHLFISLLTLMALVATPAHSQAIGEWKVYPSYWIATDNVAVGNTVYSLCNGNLLRYDAEDTSVKTYDCLSDLSDIHIDHIAYSTAAKRLIIVYDNGNIDLLDKDDNIQNISALKDKSIANKTVNSITVDGTTAYLCTGFGFITVDMKEGVILDTYQLGLNALGLCVSDDGIRVGVNNGGYFCPAASNMHEVSNWKQYANFSDVNRIIGFCGKLVCLHRNKSIFVAENGWTKTFLSKDANTFLNLSNGRLIYGNANGLSYMDNLTDSPTQLAFSNSSQAVSYANNMFWASEGSNGLNGYKASADGSVSKTVSGIQPNSPARDLFYRMHYEGERLLVAGGSANYSGINNPGTAMYYEVGEWTNFKDNYLSDEDLNSAYPDITHYNFTDLVQDPLNSDHFYAGSFRNGLYDFLKGSFRTLYNCDNSQIHSILPTDGHYYLYCPAMGLQYDAEGNLWMLNAETDTIIRYLTPKGNWGYLPYSDIKGAPTPTDYLFTTSGVNFVISQRMDNRGFFGFYTNGTLAKTSDDYHKLRSTITNEDNTSYSPNQFYCMAEDLDGAVWCGTNEGLFVIDTPTEFFDNDFTFNQIKIARNDGSGLADYLLSGVVISCIAVDGGNRKWIGTYGNGIYLVSADGQEMIHHFQADDSPLLSDNINCIAINPVSGLVMIGTDAGLCSYMSDAKEAEESLDYDNILAYPNPVKPDYTGPITIDGLTQDAEVKICSSSGQLIMSGTSNGGRFTWNGRNKQGKRVSSGVYQVIANTSDGKKAVVTRIIVIK